MATHSGIHAWRIPWVWWAVVTSWTQLKWLSTHACTDGTSSQWHGLISYLSHLHLWAPLQPWLDPKALPKGPGGWAGRAALQTLQWIWELPSLMTALFGLGKRVCVFVFRNGLIFFFSWNLPQWWYMLVCPLLRSRIKSYPNGDIDAPKGIQVCWDRWTRNREGQTWLHVESTLLALTLVL